MRLYRAQCWEFMKCGRESGGAKATQHGVCPSYPDSGRYCWKTAGTLCDGGAVGTFAMKMDSCENCGYYRNVKAGMV